MNKIDISFVTIEYNCLNELKSCIQSIQSKCADVSYEIIVSSNSAYSSEARSAITDEYRNIKWIYNNKNLGFAKALNIGISSSSGNCIVIANPDAKICDGNILSAYKYLKTNPDVGIIGPRIIDKSGNLQDSCRHFMTPFDLLIRIAKRVLFKQDVLLNQEFNYDKIQPVDWVIGAFMILRKDAIEKVGLLDEGYFLYVEDMDWCKRFWNHGYKVVYYPYLEVEYKGDRKSLVPLIGRGFINRYTMYHIKNYLKFLRKNWGNIKQIKYRYK